MEKIKLGALEFTSADNEAIERFMRNFTSEKELESFLFMAEGELESMGFIMNAEHNVGILVKNTGWVDQLKDTYAQAKVETVKLTKATLKALIDEEKYMRYDESSLDPNLVLQAMNVFEAFENGGTTVGVRAMATKDMPVWFINEEGLGILIAPCVGVTGHVERGVTQSDLEKLELEELRRVYVTASINMRCLEVFSNIFRDYCVFAGTYTDKSFTRKAFDSLEEYRNMVPIVKKRLLDAYLGLEVTGEDLKN